MTGGARAADDWETVENPSIRTYLEVFHLRWGVEHCARSRQHVSGRMYLCAALSTSNVRMCFFC